MPTLKLVSCLQHFSIMCCRTSYGAYGHVGRDTKISIYTYVFQKKEIGKRIKFIRSGYICILEEGIRQTH
jgi:hypothetical protein